MSQAPADAQSTPAPLGKAYQPAETEPAVWQRWLDADAFHADPNRVLAGEADPYCVLIPPPNVTAALHLGHALNNTIQDVLVRAHRMKGFETLWMPGTDHAGIATQTKVEQHLIKTEGKRRIDYDRDAFIEKTQAWKDEYEARITEQLQAMGCSCDWDRQRFTMDPVCARAVREAFFRLFRDGLIERGKRLVNWDPVTQTALADDEVENQEIDGGFYYLRYPLVHPAASGDHSPRGQAVTWSELAARGYPGADEQPEDDEAYITVATTRPETYLGDTAVAVSPKDPRAAALQGLRAEIPLAGRTVPILQDDYVVLPVSLGGDENDPKAQYATGFLKVTPAHDPNDWELGLRHKARIEAECSAATHLINVMAPDASISADHGWPDYNPASGAHIFVGLSREDARQKVVEVFKAHTVGNSAVPLLENVRDYRHSVGHSYRSHAAIEPYLSDQWYCRVTDDRLRGNAQRALKPDQRTEKSLESWPESRPAPSFIPSSPSGTGVPPVRPTPDPSGTGVPPVRSPAVHRQRRHLPHWHKDGSTYFITFRVATGELEPHERRLVLDACFHFQSDRHDTQLAVVMPDHVHLLIRPLAKPDGSWWTPTELLHSIKSYTAHQINESRRTSGPVWQDESFDRIVRDEDEFREKWTYMLNNPVKAGLAGEPSAYPFTRAGDDADRRDACPTGGSTDARMTFFPARYAKTYETWHDNLRDWCISRQLWWGHRIPVWSRERLTVADAEPRDSTPVHWKQEQHWADKVSVQTDATHEYVCVAPCDDEPNIVRDLLADGYAQDPDVLDTWFSSALWPLSTLGWPDTAAASADDPRADDFDALLEAFNPSTVLTTAREIITLWVSRMVMFNRYLLSTDDQTPSASGTGVPPVRSTQHPQEDRRDACPTSPTTRRTPGPAPYRDVFIHAMIQDGDGRKMSKSLGNGVDPLDIIHSHGADAMRFTLAQMTTQTQDVRMPVERDPETGRNTSPKFDAGRNFCNKLWNAARFALNLLEDAAPPALPIDPEELSLTDRWMLSRVARATKQINDSLKNYEFKTYADAAYDLLWRDFCDWYLEAIKPTVRDDSEAGQRQRAVLRVTLDAILRLLHPITPFITESIHERLRTLPMPEINGFHFASTKSDATLCQSGWPAPDPALLDEPAEEAMARVRTLVDAIRQVRALRQVPPKRQIVLHTSAALAADCARWSPLIETLAGVREVTPGEPDASAAPFSFEGAEHRLGDLADAADAGAERDRLTKQIADLDKSIGALDKRLSNPGYTDKAPAKLVEESRAQLATLKADRDAAQRSLDALA